VTQRLAAALARENASATTSDFSAALLKSRTPTQLLVLGMHHSGTSLLCRALTLMNVYGGERHDFHLMSGDNPPKWWERKDMINLNLLLFQRTAAERDKWFSGFGYAAAAVDNTTNRLFEYRARKVIDKLNRRRPWVAKEPRLSVTLRHWRPLLDAPVCVFLYRHPMAVTSGLLRHWPTVNRRFSEHEWLLLWEKYTVGALRGCAGLPLVLVSHEHLAQAPHEALRLLHEDLQSLGVPNVKLPNADDITTLFGAPFFQPVISSANISVNQYRLFEALDTNRVRSHFYEVAPDAWNWWGDVTPELEQREWVNANVNALNYTPAWQVRANKLQKALKRDMRDAKLATARRLLGFDDAEEGNNNSDNNNREAADDDGELKQLRARMKRSIRANAGAAPRQRVSTWHADLVPVVRELESRDASDAEVAAAVEAARRSLGTAAAAATPANNSSSGESLGDILARVANSERDVVAVYANLAFADLTRNLVCHLRRLNMSNFFRAGARRPAVRGDRRSACGVLL
jgi:hypothetical protein